MEAKIITKVTGTAHIEVDPNEQRRCINLHFLGNKNCCKLEGDHLVPIEHKDIDKVTEAHYHISSNYVIDVEADLTEEGRLINFRVI
jgi:hypothetical protein